MATFSQFFFQDLLNFFLKKIQKVQHLKFKIQIDSLIQCIVKFNLITLEF